jgi:hypothetical protein
MVWKKSRTAVYGSRTQDSCTDVLRTWTQSPTQMAVVLLYSFLNPRIELNLSIILQSRAHCNGSDATRDASVKNHYCYRAITQTLITNRAFTDTRFLKTKLQSTELNAACDDTWRVWRVRLPDSLVSERSPYYVSRRRHCSFYVIDQLTSRDS